MTDIAPRVTIVDLGRDGALGAVRRIASWQAIWTHVGAEVSVVPLVKDCRARARDLVTSVPECLRRPDIAPESLLWSRHALRSTLASLRPDVVVCTTARSYHPAVVPAYSVTVLDLVDRLSE